jgi:hypothetical protein
MDDIICLFIIVLFGKKNTLMMMTILCDGFSREAADEDIDRFFYVSTQLW